MFIECAEILFGDVKDHLVRISTGEFSSPLTDLISQYYSTCTVSASLAVNYNNCTVTAQFLKKKSGLRNWLKFTNHLGKTTLSFPMLKKH